MARVAREFPSGSMVVLGKATTGVSALEAEPNVARQLAGKRIVKRVYVPDRIVNFVVAG